MKRNNTLTLDRIRRVCKKKRKEEEKKENKGYNRGMCHGKRVEDLQKGKVGTKIEKSLWRGITHGSY